ncbi:MAG: hypothetical protein K2L70_07130 [Clostridia bacterium]|nr:hypothetical protein [Clostridia bacterium]
MSIIYSDELKVKIDEVGSSLLSIENEDGLECIWQGDEASWTGHDVTIFPFVGRLKDGYYTVDNVEYYIPSHGICRRHNFTVASKQSDSVTHIFKWDEETLEVYPFKFELTIEHRVESAKYIKTMTVKNVDDKEIYYGIGGHPAMNVVTERGDTANNFVVFNRQIAPNNYYLDEAGHFIEKKDKYQQLDKLSCAKSTMRSLKTLIFTDEKFDGLELQRPDGVTFKFEFSNPSALAFWSHPTSGAYYCVEPWWGVPDFASPARELKDKELIEKLAPGESRQYVFSIEITHNQ